MNAHQLLSSTYISFIISVHGQCAPSFPNWTYEKNNLHISKPSPDKSGKKNMETSVCRSTTISPCFPKEKPSPSHPSRFEGVLCKVQALGLAVGLQFLQIQLAILSGEARLVSCWVFHVVYNELDTVGGFEATNIAGRATTVARGNESMWDLEISRLFTDFEDLMLLKLDTLMKGPYYSN